MKRKLMGMLLAVFAAAMMMPALAFADEVGTADYTLVLSDGKQYANEAIAENELTGSSVVPGIAWDAESQTWTFDGVSFTTSASSAIVIEDADAKLNILGNNVLKCTNANGRSVSIGLDVQGKCLFTGKGTLSATSGKAANGNDDTNSYSYGVYTTGNTIIDGPTINAYAGESINFSIGFHTDGSSFVIENGTLNAVGNTADKDEYLGYSIGLNTEGDVNVCGGTINATGGEGETSYGMLIYGNFNIEGGTVNAQYGESPYSLGLYVLNDAIFAGGVIKAGDHTTEKYSSEYAYGIGISGNAVIKGDAMIEATAGKSSISKGFDTGEDFSITSGSLVTYGVSTGKETSCGLDVAGDASITGGNVLAGAIVLDEEEPDEGGYSSSLAIAAQGNVTVSGNDTYVTCLSRDGNVSWGLYAGNNVMIDNGTVSAWLDNETEGSFNRVIHAQNGDITITGGTVYASSEAIDYSIGMFSYGGVINITGGDVTLKGKTQAVSSSKGPLTTGMQVKASESFDGADVVTLSDWKGDGTDDVSAYQYLKFEQCEITEDPEATEEDNQPTDTTNDPTNATNQSTLAKTGDGAAMLALTFGGIFLASLVGLVITRRKTTF